MIQLVGYFIVTALVGLITAAVVYARWKYGTLEKIKGLPAVITPSFVGGSDIRIYKKVIHEQDKENVKKYGKVFGYYEGREPHIYIADPELVRLIFIKDFDHFQNKRILDFGHELINEMMDVLPYAKWKVVRSYLSPTFTTGKIRNMSIAMTETIDDWMQALIQKMKEKESFTPKRIYTALTSDVIARCGFGTKLNSLHDPDNIFIRKLKDIALEDHDVNFMLTFAQTFAVLMKFFPLFPTGSLEFFADILKTTMRERRKNNLKVNDFVDSLNEMLEKVETDPEYKKHGITEVTIMCQAMVFFIAGFETTASTLTYLTYNLSKYPDIQDKLVAEVDAYLERNNGKIEHETIQELTYMTACMNETLRMFAPLIRVERVCNKDWYHEPTGLHIPKGITVQVPVHSIHYNEEYYPEPHKFKPERFLTENKDKFNPYTFLAFGSGPHNCIGMRFAKEEILMTMTNVLQHFTFTPNAETKLKFQPGRPFLISAEPFTVDAVQRTKK